MIRSFTKGADVPFKRFHFRFDLRIKLVSSKIALISVNFIQIWPIESCSSFNLHFTFESGEHLNNWHLIGTSKDAAALIDAIKGFALNSLRKCSIGWIFGRVIKFHVLLRAKWNVLLLLLLCILLVFCVFPNLMTFIKFGSFIRIGCVIGLLNCISVQLNCAPPQLDASSPNGAVGFKSQY